MARKPAEHTDPPTTDRLRADIDSGKTGEKVRYPDPAAAPLGSDDEAAGQGPTPSQRRMEADSRADGEAPSRRGPGAFWTYGFLILVVGLLIVAVAMMLS